MWAAADMRTGMHAVSPKGHDGAYLELQQLINLSNLSEAVQMPPGAKQPCKPIKARLATEPVSAKALQGKTCDSPAVITNHSHASIISLLLGASNHGPGSTRKSPAENESSLFGYHYHYKALQFVQKCLRSLVKEDGIIKVELRVAYIILFLLLSILSPQQQPFEHGKIHLVKLWCRQSVAAYGCAGAACKMERKMKDTHPEHHSLPQLYHEATIPPTLPIFVKPVIAATTVTSCHCLSALSAPDQNRKLLLASYSCCLLGMLIIGVGNYNHPGPYSVNIFIFKSIPTGMLYGPWDRCDIRNPAAASYKDPQEHGAKRPGSPSPQHDNPAYQWENSYISLPQSGVLQM
ncbi:Synaptonemal complex protein 2-like [Varanus komodoensis]|nr:Synaptonemal complex protein 2-like [Varanus komodoensis]